MPKMDGDVVLTTRVRLARNYADLPFPRTMSADAGAESQLRTANAMARAQEGRDYVLLHMHGLEDARRRMLTERGLITRELSEAGEFAALLLRRDEKICVMINEEDHLRIHAILPGNALQQAAEMTFAIDEAIGRRVRYAFDADLGFLTSCPANVGTGLRASAMVHLPALMRVGGIPALSQELSRMGLSLRPAFGKGDAPQGDLYLLQNQISLGRTEEDLLGTVSGAVHALVERERSVRELMLLSADSRLEDRVFRSLGILRHARRLSEGEWIRRWSDVRLGVQAGFIQMGLEALDALLCAVRPAHLEEAAGKTLSPVERDEQRALLVREALSI